MVKVITTIVQEPFPLKKEGDMWKACRDFSFIVHCKIDDVIGDLHCNIYNECLYNGISSPCSKVIKKYYNEAKKDCCGIIHDVLYAWGGEVKGLNRKLKAGECDDILRGSLRDAGFTRVNAGVVDRAVRWFAHFGHFGIDNDREGMHLLSEVVWIPM